MAKNKTNSSFGWGSFFKYFSLTSVLAASSALSILFGLKVIDIVGFSFPLAITLGGLTGITLLLLGISKGVSLYRQKHTYEVMSDWGDDDDDGQNNTAAAAAPQGQATVYDNPLEGQKPSGFGVKEYDHLFKVVLVGDAKVGKSVLLSRFADNQFTESYVSTIGVDFKNKTIELDNNKKIKLQLWDTAGHERFRAIISSYYRGSSGILLVFDVNDEKSFNNVKVWKDDITQRVPEANIILVGNKCDDDDASPRVVSKERAEALAKELGIPYIETSAKTGHNVENCFVQLARAAYERLLAVVEQKGEEAPPTETKSGIFGRLFG